MKLSNFTIIFIIILFLILFRLDINNSLNKSNLNENIRVNNLMDNITELSLFDVIYSGVINTEKVKNNFYNGVRIFFGDEYKNFVKVLILTDEDGFYIINEGEEIKKIYYSLKCRENHEESVKELIDYIKEKYVIDLLIPINNGEADKNTIDDNTLIAVYKKRDYSIGNITYKNYSISASKLKINQKN